MPHCQTSLTISYACINVWKYIRVPVFLYLRLRGFEVEIENLCTLPWVYSNCCFYIYPAKLI